MVIFYTSINGEKDTSQSKYQVITKEHSSTNKTEDDSMHRNDGELILLFRSAYREDRMYRFNNSTGRMETL